MIPSPADSSDATATTLNCVPSSPAPPVAVGALAGAIVVLTRQAVIDPITTAIAPITLKPSSGAPVDAPREPGVTAPAGIEGPRRDPGIGEGLLIAGARGPALC